MLVIKTACESYDNKERHKTLLHESTVQGGHLSQHEGIREAFLKEPSVTLNVMAVQVVHSVKE